MDTIYYIDVDKDLGGYSSEVPPLPIPNREVKLANADGTAFSCGRVGSRLFKPIQRCVGFFLLCVLGTDLVCESYALGLKRRLCRHHCVTYPPNPLSVKGACRFAPWTNPNGWSFFVWIMPRNYTRSARKHRLCRH